MKKPTKPTQRRGRPATGKKENKIPLKKIKEAIDSQYGIVSAIAKYLGFKTDRPAIYRLIKKHKLQKQLEQARELLIDRAELNISHLVQGKNETASYFILKTLGRKRGYVERQEIEPKGKAGGVIVYLPKKLDDHGKVDTIPSTGESSGSD